MPAPTFVAEYENSQGWGVTTTPKTVSVTTAVGDVLAILTAGESDFTTLDLPTGGTGTYVNQENIDVADRCSIRVDTAVTGISAQTYTLNQANSGSGKWGFTGARFSGSNGIGAAESTNALDAAPSLSITTLQANSALVVIVGDFEANDGASRTWLTVNGFTPTAGNGQELVYFRDAAAYTVYVAYYPDAGAAGAKTVGLSAPAGQDYTIAAVEIIGIAGALASNVRFVAAGALANNATTAALATVGPACAVNDILIYAGMGKNNQVVGVPDGSWTKFVEVNNTANQRATLAWKRAVAGDIGGISYAFTKPVDDNLLNIGVISAWRGCRINATPIDASTPTTSANASSDTVTYATFDPTEFMAFIVAIGFYNDDLTTAGTVAGTDPTFTNRWDLETPTGTDGSCFGYSGPSTGVATGARSHATTSTADAVNIGVLFGLVSDTFPPLPSMTYRRTRINSHLAM